MPFSCSWVLSGGLLRPWFILFQCKSVVRQPCERVVVAFVVRQGQLDFLVNAASAYMEGENKPVPLDFALGMPFGVLPFDWLAAEFGEILGFHPLDNFVLGFQRLVNLQSPRYPILYFPFGENSYPVGFGVFLFQSVQDAALSFGKHGGLDLEITFLILVTLVQDKRNTLTDKPYMKPVKARVSG